MKAEIQPQDHVFIIEEINKGRIIRALDIIYLQANDNYCNLYLKNKEKIVVCKTLKSYEEELNSSLFFRCHKSFIVNILYIKEYIFRRNDFVIVLQDKTILQVARRRASDLKKVLQGETKKLLTISTVN